MTSTESDSMNEGFPMAETRREDFDAAAFTEDGTV